MKTCHSVKAYIWAIIVILLGSTIGFPAVQAKSAVYILPAPLAINELNIDNSDLFNDNPKSVKLEINVEELREIKKARKIALELERQKQEEEARLKAEEERKTKIVYDNLTYDELVSKLNRSLNSTISGQGEAFTKYALELGIDPYLAVAIVLHETGCSWTCSSLLRNCNNVGGMKGSPGCNGGAYASFATLSEGIRAFMYNLYNNYFKYGLTTPEAIGPKYAASTTWASAIRGYMNKIKAS